jgi:hypothetical protein
VTKAAIALHVVDYFSKPLDVSGSAETVPASTIEEAPREAPATADSKAVLSEYDWYFSAPKWSEDDEEDS